MAARVTLAGAVLAGGASRRMGRPKAFIEVGGEPMVRRVADALKTAGAEPVVVVGGDAAAVRSLGLEHCDDAYPGSGPLGGIITALRRCHAASAVLVLSCDLLAPAADEAAWVAASLAGHDVAVPVVAGRHQWTHAVWSPGALPQLEAAFERGERAPRRALAGLAVLEVESANAAAYHDADEPSDLPIDR